jgi:hypothetical protein
MHTVRRWGAGGRRVDVTWDNGWTLSMPHRRLVHCRYGQLPSAALP